MKLVAHASPSVLEAELLDRVAAAKFADPLAPVLIVVTSRRLAEHVMGRLVERFGAVLGVSVLHHRALSERILEGAGAAERRLLGEDLTDALFATVVERAAPGPLRSFVRDHPGAATTLLDALTDLREAGIDPAAATATLSGDEAETAALYARWSAALYELARCGRAWDDAALASAATPEAPAFAARFSAIFHHGAYDLIGVRSELVRALDRGREMTFLLPADPGDPAGAFGVQRAIAIAGQSSPDRLDRAARPAPVAFLNAQGARAELRTAAYEALAAVAAGARPEDVAIVVRAFGPYAAALDALIDDGPSLWHTSYKQPIRRDPKTAEALRAIALAATGSPQRFSRHADAFEAVASASGAGDRLGGLLASMREIETVLGDDRAVSSAEASGWLDARVDATTVTPSGTGPGGIRLLDAMQARGLTFSHLNLAGMNAGVFPLVARENPFLCDASRRLLREATGRPLPVAGERDGEERLLLAMLLGAARERIRVSWLRADETARPLVASLGLRDIARFASLDADASDVELAARALPAHPRSRLEAWAQHPGLLDRCDETILAALASESGADAGPAVAERRPELAPGIALVAATDSFAQTSGRYDGRIGVPALRASIAASSLERLGQCPLKYFFHDVLRVEAPRTPPTPFTADAAATGSRVHDVLRRVYAQLVEERAFERDDVGARVARARELLPSAWRESADDDAAQRAARLPLLATIESDAWTQTLGAFVDADLRRLAAEGLTPRAFERDAAKPIPGGPPDLVVRARFDRVLTGGSSPVVSDYKTGGSLADRATSGAMLSGRALQVPLYALIAEAQVELLGVGPAHDPAQDVVRFDGFGSDDVRAGVLETLRVAASLAAAGRFPIHRGDQCGWCDYRPACRRNHPPTQFREDHADDTRDARDCWRKTEKAPLLSVIREESRS